MWKLDRLGRNTSQLLTLVNSLESQGIGFQSLTEGITTIGPMGKSMLTVMAAFSQLDATSWPNAPGPACPRPQGRATGCHRRQ